ncbi:amino acid ABC transporter permease [Aliivibrio finisterrensis]|uniref:amino acid ABC transporter permease n=1 Tax=Aliivibrio finisterrensis TaxID=511998 RepID=UPI00101FC5AD|nr:amino acid ABC transporter permease [Aliivibrio finisterrensis]RYU64530.1 amino acid ABC transporter permease [Aliivibrio finisterrensis]RYU67961.1 amino acid ABC transporter permease [Aliivibrio finisterrensis]RYU70945.1 amino acid ABC transporter permease [Aliivibrio finisterrensis]
MQQRVSLKLNRLDWILLAIIASFIFWLCVKESGSLAYHWQWSRAFDLLFTRKPDGSLPYFFDGVFSTLRLTFWGMLFALLFGVLLGLGRRSSLAVIRSLSNSYIQLIRNIPPLVFIFIFYFFIANQLVPLLGLESLLRDHNGNINALQSFLFGSANLWENLASGVLCIGMISAAYIGEVVRSGLDVIPRGQHEAAKSLGLSTWHRYRYIIAPQVFKVITPPLAGQCISLVKDSSIISLISIQELTFVGTEIANSSGMIFEVWIAVAFCYFILCFTLSRLFAYWERDNTAV